ncbi:hypothetical protein GCM10009641_17960 [Mycobacterium cookii]|uniref:Uncharacterized protein n=2 Tax=Mycobacterium cookii TaxID=1775 RepID=A0A7I7L1E3_9MYCO|nr:hypothetical protein MCOO_36130 [Mycobacterium cookii]
MSQCESTAMRHTVIDADPTFGDAEIADTDVSELDLMRVTVQQSSKKVAIPDTDCDRGFWRGVEHERVGGHSSSRQFKPR